MAVFRIEKTQNYTVMSNHHLKNTKLSLKAKGLLSIMLSLPENWDYTTRGLSAICKEGIDSISTAVQELEAEGYIKRERVRNSKGQLTSIEYVIYEQPNSSDTTNNSPETNCEKTANNYANTPKRENPVLVEKDEKPKRENPVLEKPVQEKPHQSNTNILNTKLINNNIYNNNNNIYNKSIYQSNHSDVIDTKDKKTRESYKELICANIEYEALKERNQNSIEILDELVSLIVDTVCTSRKNVRIGGENYPSEVVASVFLKLDGSHLEYVIRCMTKNTSKIRNIKNYLLTALYNAPLTLDNYYNALVNHDLSNADKA